MIVESNTPRRATVVKQNCGVNFGVGEGAVMIVRESGSVLCLVACAASVWGAGGPVQSNPASVTESWGFVSTRNRQTIPRLFFTYQIGIWQGMWSKDGIISEWYI